ncbi:hypothetical protein DdX_09185 [Ditylenchus destructor]|uniref:Uncharacterized protein n=1 Tax=Ditylenchus destructor TaxID=166010 RepID=A0AAD4N016_9BILA|nr:hypothetical protein DdX_09185 [Ditylenchus destructor]
MSAILDMGFDTPEPDPTSLSTTTSLPPQEMVETNPGTEPVKETTPTEDNQDVYRRLAEVEAKLRQVEDRNVDLRAQLALAKSSESQKPSTRYEEDLKQMYEQLKYKDNRIIDLNNVIMEKERRIIDLQEACREQGQVAKAKQQAVQIVNKRLQELDGKQMRDAATEVDSSLLQQDRASRKQTAGSLAVSGSDVTSKRNESPGRAIPQFRMSGNGSPPPIDPSEDLSSYTTETLGRSDQLDADLYADPTYSPSAKGLRSKYQRKRVTFDLHQQSQQSPAKKKSSPARASPPVAGNRADADSFLQPLQKQKRPDLAGPQVSNMEDYDYADLVVENNELRRIIAEMEKVTIIPNEVQSESSKDMEVKELKEQLLQLQVEIKVQVLKARAAAQARIKELEATLNGMQCNSAKEMDALLAANEGLKASREWTLNENGKLLKKIDEMKSKMDDLHGELDASLHTNTFFRNRLDEEEKRLENLTQELIQSRRHAQEVAEERQMAQAEAQRLREALFAQDEFISMLEGDLIVYEAHVGILRDSLGASKKEDRQTIKSKAFSAKLNALEMEKKEFAKRNNGRKI